MTEITVYFRRESGNSKTGPIPVSTSGRQTCPDACQLKGNGCYADNFPMKIHWDKVTRGEKGYTWDGFLFRIKELKKNQIWRHNQAGDLIGTDNVIDEFYLAGLTAANVGRRGFTYTHYPMTPHNQRVVQLANQLGFTVNLSADTVEEADELAALGVGPVVTMLPRGWKGKTTPAGRKITVCPAQTVEYMTCSVCQLCQDPNRKAIVGFTVHGARFKVAQRVIELKQEKPHA
jgi:hypothetical protein